MREEYRKQPNRLAEMHKFAKSKAKFAALIDSSDPSTAINILELFKWKISFGCYIRSMVYIQYIFNNITT
jgi:hypothetical protein